MSRVDSKPTYKFSIAMKLMSLLSFGTPDTDMHSLIDLQDVQSPVVANFINPHIKGISVQPYETMCKLCEVSLHHLEGLSDLVFQEWGKKDSNSSDTENETPPKGILLKCKGWLRSLLE